MTTLTDLSMDMNLLGAQGAEMLAHALVKVKSLAKLSLSKNAMGAAGTRTVVAVLTGHPGLRELLLAGNGVDDVRAMGDLRERMAGVTVTF